jgi:hypothetical protein
MRKSILMFAATGLLVAAQCALADGCAADEEKAAAANMKKAEDADRAGRLKEAYAALGKVDSMCLGRDAGKRHESMRKRIGLQLGQQEEKQNRLGAAFDWYNTSGNGDEADRVKMKQVNATPRDRNLVSGAIDHFKRKNNDARVAELRQLAAKNADLELAAEEKAFAARKESLDELGHARDWYQYVGDGAAKKARDRAEQRGDALLKEDTVRHLENAKRYFNFADAKQKEKTLKDKAMRLAQEHEKKGEINQAASFYSLADASAQGNALQKRADAEHQKGEEKRQKKFSKDQGDLEKQLGL